MIYAGWSVAPLPKNGYDAKTGALLGRRPVSAVKIRHVGKKRDNMHFLLAKQNEND